MSVDLGLRFNIDMDNFKEQTDPVTYTRVFMESANDIAHDTMVSMAKDVSSKWNIDVKETSKDRFSVRSVLDNTANLRGGVMTLKRVRSTVSRGEIRIVFKGHPINLSRFVTQWKPPKVQISSIKTRNSFARQPAPEVQILRNGRKTQIKGSFAATMYSGHKGVFQRRKGAFAKVIELRTITLPSMLEQVDWDDKFQFTWDNGYSNVFEQKIAKAF